MGSDFVFIFSDGLERVSKLNNSFARGFHSAVVDKRGEIPVNKRERIDTLWRSVKCKETLQLTVKWTLVRGRICPCRVEQK
ncbi:hypothetical protein FKM82_025043 [Ascaphus truei]